MTMSLLLLERCANKAIRSRISRTPDSEECPDAARPLLEVLRQEVLAKKAEDLLELGFAQLVCDVQAINTPRRKIRIH